MSENKSSISNETSYQKIGEYWDSHDLGEVDGALDDAQFEVDVRTEAFNYPVETSLSSRINSIALKRGVSTETLINLWLSERAALETVKT